MRVGVGARAAADSSVANSIQNDSDCATDPQSRLLSQHPHLYDDLEVWRMLPTHKWTWIAGLGLEPKSNLRGIKLGRMPVDVE